MPNTVKLYLGNIISGLCIDGPLECAETEKFRINHDQILIHKFQSNKGVSRIIVFLKACFYVKQHLALGSLNF